MAPIYSARLSHLRGSRVARGDIYHRYYNIGASKNTLEGPKYLTTINYTLLSTTFQLYRFEFLFTDLQRACLKRGTVMILYSKCSEWYWSGKCNISHIIPKRTKILKQTHFPCLKKSFFTEPFFFFLYPYYGAFKLCPYCFIHIYCQSFNRTCRRL